MNEQYKPSSKTRISRDAKALKGGNIDGQIIGEFRYNGYPENIVFPPTNKRFLVFRFLHDSKTIMRNNLI